MAYEVSNPSSPKIRTSNFEIRNRLKIRIGQRPKEKRLRGHLRFRDWDFSPPEADRICFELRHSNFGFHLGFTFSVNPCTATISTAWSLATGPSLTAFQYSPSTKILPACESIGVNVVTVFPIIASAPALTGKSCARKPFPTTKTKNAAVTSVA